MRMFVLLASVGACLPVAALAAPDDARLADGITYRNSASGIEVLPVPGQVRRLHAYADQDLDVSVGYWNDTEKVEVTIYVFRRVSGDAAVWMDRIATIIPNPERFAQASMVP